MKPSLRVLVTAGNTQTPLDRVRCITNIFTGRTGARLALEAYDRGHTVTLLTSHPSVVSELRPGFSPAERWHVVPYRTFDDLHSELRQRIPEGLFDTILHSAAVSDYSLAGVYAPTGETTFDHDSLAWKGPAPHLRDAAQGKVKSSHPELWLRLVPTPKLVDQMRTPWGFAGVLVKFKLEVEVSESELLAIARQSRAHSGADFLVANTLDSYETTAFLIDRENTATILSRELMPARLWDAIELETRSP